MTAPPEAQRGELALDGPVVLLDHSGATVLHQQGRRGQNELDYHLAWMFQDLGVPVVALDLDPQANLTTAFLREERLLELWPEGEHPRTIPGAVQPLMERLGDLADPHVEAIEEGLGLVPGDLGLSLSEDRLAEAWPRALEDKATERDDALRVLTAFRRCAERAAARAEAELVLLDWGPAWGR